MSLSHTFHYEDVPDFISQMREMTDKLEKNYGQGKPLIDVLLLEPYHIVRARYPKLASPAFTMRLKRFRGRFPHEMGPKGRKILKLFVTPELDAYLSK